jgi:hypothetical protein
MIPKQYKLIPVCYFGYLVQTRIMVLLYNLIVKNFGCGYDYFWTALITSFGLGNMTLKSVKAHTIFALLQ